jgi:DHA1 family bicyclomycin/chloramphenicol resistance-like MFS transporter
MTPHAAVHPVRLAALLALIAMFGAVHHRRVLSPAFHAVQKDLGASDWQMQQTISVYLWAYALMSLFPRPALGRIRAPAGDPLGRAAVRAQLARLRVLSAASGSCCSGRRMQGFCTGAGLIVGRAIVRDLFEGRTRRR